MNRLVTFQRHPVAATSSTGVRSESYGQKTKFSTHSQDAACERSTYVRRKEAEDVALAIRLSMWRHLRDMNREAKPRNSSVLICHFLAGYLTTIVAILLHLGRL